MKKAPIIIILLLLTYIVKAQQDPQYTQYMYNMIIMNPAYAGSKENLSFGLLYRKQWSGFDGAPTTATFFGHAPISEKVGFGLSVISDEIGPVKETNMYADFSYTLNFKGENKFSFGLKAGATFHDIGLTNLDLVDPNDVFFSEDINSSTPNIGAGVFYHTKKFYLGASVPNMLSSVHLDVNGTKLGSESSHYFFTGGYVFKASENTKLKPSFLVKSSFKAPTSFDFNLNALLYDKFEIGASCRYGDSFSGLVNFAITPNLRIGYAYDNITSEINAYAPASHEFMILFDLVLSKRVSRSPRFF